LKSHKILSALPAGVFLERKKKAGLREDTFKMDLFRKLYVKADELARGQTMAEYALIVAAIAVVAFAGYQATGTTINTLVSGIDTNL
jgi:Flp pilus assembly pilin Flp